MKRLYLLRHAKAMPSEGESDIERHLAPKGIEDAKALGALMKNKGYQPGCIECSPSVRTKETLEGLMDSIEETKIHYETKIYNASRSDLFAMIQNKGNDCDALMLIGHNPAIHELAAMLAAEGDGSLIGELMTKYPPGTLCMFDCPKATWADIQPAENVIVDFLTPDKYNDPGRPTRWM